MSDHKWDNDSKLQDLGVGNVPGFKGVKFHEPPPEILPKLLNHMTSAINAIPPGATGAIIGTATTSGWNAAVVAKNDKGWAIQAWVGSNWGEPVGAGAAVMKSW